MTVEWKSPTMITALCPGSTKEGKGDIIIATKSGGLGSCTVQLRVFKESVGPLKEVAVWTQEKYFTRRKNRILSPTGGTYNRRRSYGQRNSRSMIFYFLLQVLNMMMLSVSR